MIILSSPTATGQPSGVFFLKDTLTGLREPGTEPSSPPEAKETFNQNMTMAITLTNSVILIITSVKTIKKVQICKKKKSVCLQVLGAL